ncbi:hypothetical protein GWK48_09395 [Metallosphaera tengchongensis]|uniref:Uncharacterized protein n=1 Tax=Metallosphaera tengchongensis TaxID=1532350 RepID=A0A6N0NUK1_9CREN|nr:hypothetical protein [Metallosphaera tengchongensis]QKR00564.1 hypothetical protein GWK48_09395 [Metallosphaera tengchongensis]
MKVKIKSLGYLKGRDSLVVIPLAESGKYVLCLNFFEDVEDGRLARFVIVEDKYGELTDVKLVEGDEVMVEAEEVKGDMDTLSKLIRIERARKSSVVPLFINVEVKDEIRGDGRGVRGYFNYVRKYGQINLQKLRGKLTLSFEEVPE